MHKQCVKWLMYEAEWELAFRSWYFLRLSDTARCAKGQKQDMILKMTDCISHGNGHAVRLTVPIRTISAECKFPQMLLILHIWPHRCRMLIVVSNALDVTALAGFSNVHIFTIFFTKCGRLCWGSVH